MEEDTITPPAKIAQELIAYIAEARAPIDAEGAACREPDLDRNLRPAGAK